MIDLLRRIKRASAMSKYEIITLQEVHQ